MNVALFFITHDGIASNLLSIGEAILQKKNNNLCYLEIPMDANITSMKTNIESKLAQLDLTLGLLLITDIYGSTPSNIAQTIADKYQANLISGVNLPMVIRLLNYRDHELKKLQQQALDGAKHGIQIHTFKSSQTES